MMTSITARTMTSAAMAAADFSCRRCDRSAQMYTAAIRMDAAFAASIFVVLAVAAAVVCLSASLITLISLVLVITLITLISLITLLVLSESTRLRSEYRD